MYLLKYFHQIATLSSNTKPVLDPSMVSSGNSPFRLDSTWDEDDNVDSAPKGHRQRNSIATERIYLGEVLEGAS